MVGKLRGVMWLPAVALVACGGTESGQRASGDETAGIVTAGATEGETEGSGSASATDSASSESASASGSATDATASATASASDSVGETGETKFDLGLAPDGALGCGEGGMGGGNGGAPDFSYIWIANSNEGTISKINTQTLVEEGRYIVRPDSAGNPSRTSVNLNGDVVVANRAGGVTMIAARPEDCPDPANTSTGADDVKDWPDGCVVWHTPFNYTSQRPVAWTQGDWSPSACRYENTKVWTSGANDTIDVLLLDGETGEVEQTIPVPGVSPNYFGIYGAAVDADGNFWGSMLGQATLVNISLADFSLQTWPMGASGYGMTVDSQGNVWTCSSVAARFDPVTETWDVTGSLGGGGYGCMEDGEGTLWVAGDPVVGVDINTLQVVQTIDVPSYVRGISIDFEGYVWGPAISANEAYRMDPVAQTLDTVTGLNYPYTYSDMTGFALSNAGNPSG